MINVANTENEERCAAESLKIVILSSESRNDQLNYIIKKISISSETKVALLIVSYYFTFTFICYYYYSFTIVVNLVCVKLPALYVGIM